MFNSPLISQQNRLLSLATRGIVIQISGLGNRVLGSQGLVRVHGDARTVSGEKGCDTGYRFPDFPFRRLLHAGQRAQCDGASRT